MPLLTTKQQIDIFLTFERYFACILFSLKKRLLGNSFSVYLLYIQVYVRKPTAEVGFMHFSQSFSDCFFDFPKDILLSIHSKPSRVKEKVATCGIL